MKVESGKLKAKEKKVNSKTKDEFRIYRLAKGYATNTIKVQNHHLCHFLQWCLGQNIDHLHICYDKALQYIDHQRKRGLKNISIIRSVNSIKIYFEYLTKTKAIKHNIFCNITINRSADFVLPELLTEKQLDDIYERYCQLPSWKLASKRLKLLHQRNTVILGLLVYQGLLNREIARIESKHVDLNKGRIYIASGKRTNERVLLLKATQILSFKSYLEQIYPSLAEKSNQSAYFLFPCLKHSDLISRILQQAKQIEPKVKGARQIRISVLMCWLKQYNLRQVQYMIGHKNIISTEQYKKHDIVGLSQQVEMFHPLK